MAIADLIIRLKDQASSGLGRLQGALGGLTQRAASAASDTSGLASAMRDGVLQASAIQFGIQKASEAIGFLNNKFEESKNLQLEQINAATTFSALTGQSSEQASKFIQNLNDQLAKSAATLPGATQDYKALAIAVQDNVLEAFKDPSGTLNQEGFEKTLISMSESFGALTAASTRDIGNTSLGLSKALGGASIAELRDIAFFQQNPVILNEIEKRLAAQGKQFKDLNIRERVQMLQEVGQKFITEDFKRSAAESVDGLLQSFYSTLFDPSAGIFGIMRDLDPQTDGVQSAFSSLNDALKELIGADGVFTQASEILTAAGVELADPMAMLKGAIDVGVAGLKRVNAGLAYVKDFLEAGGTLTDALRLAAGLLPRFDGASLVDRAQGFVGSLGDRVAGMISRVGSLIAPLFNRGVAIISNQFANTGAVAGLAYSIGVTLGAWLGKASGAVVSVLSQIDYPALLVGIGRVAIGLVVGIAAAIAGAIGGWGLGMMSGVRDAAMNAANSVTTHARDYLLALGQTLVDAVALLLWPIRQTLGRIPLIGRAVNGILDVQMGALRALLTGGIGGLFSFWVSTAKLLITSAQQTIRNITQQIRSLPVVGGIVDRLAPAAAVPPRPAAPAGARYSGQVGTAAGGLLGNLLSAARTELRRMPAGAELVVANSSETILPAGILGQFVRSLLPSPPPRPIAPTPIAVSQSIAPAPTAPSPTTAERVVMPVTININGASQDLQAIAQTVVDAIQARFDAAMQAQLG